MKKGKTVTETKGPGEPAEIIRESDYSRMIRLSFEDDFSDGIEEHIVEFTPGSVTLLMMCSKKKPKRFVLSVEEMDTLAASWQEFRRDEAEREARDACEFEAEQQARIAELSARAEALGIKVQHGSDERYALIFPSGSHWAHFWDCSTYLTLSTIEDCLSIIEHGTLSALGEIGNDF